MGAKAAAKGASKAAGKSSRPAAATGRAAKTTKAVKSTAAARPAKQPAKPAIKAEARKPAAKPKAKRRAAAPAIDVKMSAVGTAGRPVATSGLSFLSGKPGSSGPANPALDTKPRLSKTKLTSRELARFRDLLLAKRRQLQGDMEGMEREALQGEGSNLSHLPVHMADMGTDVYEQEFTLSLVDRDRKMVEEIDIALNKIDKKTYGICEGTGQMISKTRLEAQPWTRYSIEYARHLQRPGIRREE